MIAASEVHHTTDRSCLRCLSHTCPSDVCFLIPFDFILYIQPSNIQSTNIRSSTIAHCAIALYTTLHHFTFIPSNIPYKATMLPYLWLLLPTLASAAHRVPRSHGSHWILTPRELASPTAPPTILATPSASDSPCKRVSLAVQPSNDTINEPGGRVPAELAYECLNSIPFNQSAAAALLESMRPYLEWQSSTSYVKDPPEKVRKSIPASLSCTDFHP